MPIGLGSGLWAAVQPLDETNLATNPSFEFGSAGVVAIQSATLGTTSQFQRYGAWSLRVTPSSNGTSGAILGTWVSGIGTTYSVSVWAFVEQGVPMRMGVGDGNGLNLTSGTVTFTGGGTWQWYNTGIIEVSNTNRAVVLQKTSGNSQLPYYADGVKISPWTDSLDRITTYFDGDTGGGTWLGAQQASTSVRSGQYRSGGSIVALADLGLQVDQMLGVGMPPIEVSSQSYAVTDGAQFQRQRAAARKFTLTAKPISGTSLADFHNVRRTLIDVFKPDLVTPQQPVRLLYYGAQGTQQIDAYYEKGLELGNMDGPIAESLGVSFVTTDPYWYAPVQQGTTLAPRIALGSVNHMARRSPQGKWGSVGQAGGANGVVYDILLSPSGTLFAAGSFTAVDGTAGARFLAQYIPQTNTFGTLAGGTANDIVRTLAISPSGTLFAGGDFTTIGGTTGGRFLGMWRGNNFGTLVGGTVAALVTRLAYAPTGTLFVGGQFLTTAGTTSGPLVTWVAGAFGTLTTNGGSISNASGPEVDGLLYASDGALYASGTFSRAAGTLVNHAARYKGGTWYAMGSGFGNALGFSICQVVDIAQGPNGVVYFGGAFGTAGGVLTNSIAQWNGVALTPMPGGGVGIPANQQYVRALNVNQKSGVVLAGGNNWGGSAGSVAVPDNIALNNLSSWLPLDIELSPAGAVLQAIEYGNDGYLYIAGTWVGTAQAASVGTIVNSGRGVAYPHLRLRNRSATGTAHLYQLLNTTTNAGIYFNYSMLPGEQADLELKPGARSFQSSMRGNILGNILPGSNLATFDVAPGTNYVSFFSDNDSLEAAFFWQPAGWSIDSGTIL